MKYKIKKQIENEIEIELPYFFKLDNKVIDSSYFAIINENLAVSNWRKESLNVSSSTGHIADLINSENFVEITKEEFKIQLTQTCNTLINLI
jgi:hypothetical protein